MWLCRPSEIPETEPQSFKGELPKGAFRLAPEAYETLGDKVLALQFRPPSLRLPDLKNTLVYYGKNARPDALGDKALFHISLMGAKEAKAVEPKEKLYLVYNRKGDGPKYAFSNNNEPTSLWIECEPMQQEALVEVHLLDENNQPIREPESCASFVLPEKEFSRNMALGWEIGKWRVDATLLARQKARWYGPDRFLEDHGGDEYKEVLGAQRVDFGEAGELYSLFLKAGDCLIYENDRWRVLKPGENASLHSLLVVKKIDERLMGFELWDVRGKGKIPLNLLKSTENFTPGSFEAAFKFLGARTRSQFVFEIDSERMTLRPQDWLLLTGKGWKKLTTPEEIDEYVNRQSVGPLFVFDEILRKEDKQVMKGTVYNQNRTESYPIELAMQPALTPTKGNDKIVPPLEGHKNLESVGQRKARIEPPSYAKQD